MKISFLTSCMDRCHHLKKTYLRNIKQNMPTPNCQVEFVLLNYNSKDDVSKWVDENLSDCKIEFKYIETNKPKYFHMSKTKNILGKHATGDILCWLDADNLSYTGFVEYIYKIFSSESKIAFKVGYTKQTKGMCGRVVCRKNDFLKINGYDEEMVGWGYEELDFCERLKHIGIKLIELPKSFIGKIEHTDEERFRNYPKTLIENLHTGHVCSEMQIKSNYINFRNSQKNMSNNNYIANKNRKWGLL